MSTASAMSLCENRYVLHAPPPRRRPARWATTTFRAAPRSSRRRPRASPRTARAPRLAVGDLLDVPHGRALHELRRALVQLALQALLPRRHVLDFVRPSPGGGGGESPRRLARPPRGGPCGPGPACSWATVASAARGSSSSAVFTIGTARAGACAAAEPSAKRRSALCRLSLFPRIVVEPSLDVRDIVALIPSARREAAETRQATLPPPRRSRRLGTR